MMKEKNRTWYYLIPFIGMGFCLWYLYISFYDVVYSDYIRLVNSYLPDIFNAGKFFVPDILTRSPITYLERIINVLFFHYSIRFDQVLGVIGLGLSALVVSSYCVRQKIGAAWYLMIMILLFSLNKWEMLINGSGWFIFLAFAGFYYHYLIIDRIRAGEEKRSDHVMMIILPWIMILLVAGSYCAVYAAVLLISYVFCYILDRKERPEMGRRYLIYAINVIIPFACYLVSNSMAVTDWSGYDVAEGSIFGYIFEMPGYFIRFLLKSLSSAVLGQESAAQIFSSDIPYIILGLIVAFAYLSALWLQFKDKLYEKSILPLIFIAAGGMNHLIILVSRWNFLVDDYGMSSRYGLQFQMGPIGIFLTYALALRCSQKKKELTQAVCISMAVIFIAGSAVTAAREVNIARYRKETCVRRAETALDYENKTDDELREVFEYRTSWPDSGPLIRQALTILKDNNLNVFHGRY